LSPDVTKNQCFIERVETTLNQLAQQLIFILFYFSHTSQRYLHRMLTIKNKFIFCYWIPKEFPDATLAVLFTPLALQLRYLARTAGKTRISSVFTQRAHSTLVSEKRAREQTSDREKIS
jgi:hypothetical protein